jgi:hypothetical protein
MSDSQLFDLMDKLEKIDANQEGYAANRAEKMKVLREAFPKPRGLEVQDNGDFSHGSPPSGIKPRVPMAMLLEVYDKGAFGDGCNDEIAAGWIREIAARYGFEVEES